MKREPLNIRCADGAPLAGLWFSAAGGARAAVVIAPALGVPQAFYRPMAEFLATQGFGVLTFDYRGSAESGPMTPDPAVVRLDQWGRLDIDAVLGAAMQRADGKRFLLGHSAGAQLFGMAPNSEHLDGLVMVSSLIPWWRSFPWPWNLQVWFLMHFIMPVFSFGRGTFPARKLRISSVDVPSGVTRQWSRWGRHRDYFFDPRWGLDVSRYSRFRFPVLVCHIDDDHYAPWPAIQALLRKMPNIRQEIWHVESARSPAGAIGHVDFFREAHRDIFWRRISDWLTRQSAGPGAGHYD